MMSDRDHSHLNGETNRIAVIDLQRILDKSERNLCAVVVLLRGVQFPHSGPSDFTFLKKRWVMITVNLTTLKWFERFAALLCRRKIYLAGVWFR